MKRLVRLGLFDRVEIFTLDVSISAISIMSRSVTCRMIAMLSSPASFAARMRSLTGQLIAVTRTAHQHRLKHAIRFDRGQLANGLLVNRTRGWWGLGADVLDRDLGNARAIGRSRGHRCAREATADAEDAPGISASSPLPNAFLCMFQDLPSQLAVTSAPLRAL